MEPIAPDQTSPMDIPPRTKGDTLMPAVLDNMFKRPYSVEGSGAGLEGQTLLFDCHAIEMLKSSKLKSLDSNLQNYTNGPKLVDGEIVRSFRHLKKAAQAINLMTKDRRHGSCLLANQNDS